MSGTNPDYHGFQSTLWSVVIAAGDAPSDEASSALEKLCEIYWPPLYSFAFSRTRDPHEAEDLTQAFFEQLLERNDISEVDRERGRFRAFLLASMKNFMAKQWDRKKALKRGGGKVTLSLEQLSEAGRLELESAASISPDDQFERQWALTLVNSVFSRLRSEFCDAGNAARYEVLSGFILGEVEESAYAETAESLGLTASAVRSAVLRIRRRFRVMFHETVSQTVATPEEVETEMRHLLAAIS